MWKRRELKDRAKLGLKRNYWKSVLVSLIFVMTVGTLGVMSGAGSSFGSFAANSAAVSGSDYTFNLIPPQFFVGILIFALIIIAFAAVMAIAVVNPFAIGIYRYNLSAVRGTGNIADLGNGFDVNYKRNVKVMFFVDLYTVLWSMLFIIPGIVKSYEYKMIPYLLTDNPEMDKKEAFETSKAMMKGNKWRAFVLDLSFILWDILNALTLGIVGTFWLSPYKLLTAAALYDALKEN